ncbi:blh, partial [Symbiodinium pilosum]
DAWRRLAWACASAGQPQVEAFGDPPVQASSTSSAAVWKALERRQELLPDKCQLVQKPFPLLKLERWITDKETEALLTAASSGHCWRPSPLAVEPLPGATPTRTSESAVLADVGQLSSDASAVVSSLRERAACEFGLPESHVEPLQLVRYRAGEFYAAHVDFGRKEDATLWLAGQRLATLLVYLRAPAGSNPGFLSGETRPLPAKLHAA